jgi:hypothetical protein
LSSSTFACSTWSRACCICICSACCCWACWPFCSAAAWLAHGDAVLAREPVERVTLTSYPPFYWFMNNLPPNWPAGGRHSPVERPVALDALEHCWPGVAFTLPPEPVQRWQVTEPDGPDASSADWLVRYVRDAVARGTAEHIDRQFRAG